MQSVAERQEARVPRMRLVPIGAGRFRLVLAAPLSTPTRLGLFSVDGRRVHTFRLASDARETVLNLSGFASGVYLLQVPYPNTTLRLVLMR